MSKEKLDYIKENFPLTTNGHESIFILPDGTMIDGQFDDGSRGIDHNIILGVYGKEGYDNPTETWIKVHGELNLVRTVPEANMALIKTNQELTLIQKQIIEEIEFEIEIY
jgi:hypothetical protein